MIRFSLAFGLAVATAAPALAVVGAPAATDPAGARRSAVALVLERGLCTGVLIERDLILTAAHCLARNRVRAIVSLDAQMKPRFLSAAGAVAHPSFRYADKPANAAGADLALVRLAAPAPADMAPAPITSFGETGDLMLAGFGVGGERAGKAGTLRELPMRARAMTWREGRMIAAIGGSSEEARLGTGGCRGDSGGPVYAAGSSSVVGIVSWSSGPPGTKSSCGGLTMATEIGSHAQWISSAAAALRFGQGVGRAEISARRARPNPTAPAPRVRDVFPDLSRDTGR